jgi:type VI secretion system secreted protein VgrG
VAGENISFAAGMNITASAGMNIMESAGASIGHNAMEMISHFAGKDYSLMAANIMKVATGNIETNADTIHREGKNGVTIASEGEIIHDSSETVKNQSGENTFMH